MDKWTPQLEKMTRQGGTRTAHGSSCAFVQLTDHTGIKLYATKLERDASWVALGLAAEHGLAPEVGECVEIKGGIAGLRRPGWWPEEFNPETLYGFLTEVVDVGGDVAYNTLMNLKWDLNDLFDREVVDIERGNIGFKEDGTLVAIDLDGRFCGLMTDADIAEVNKIWGGNFW